MRINFYPTLFLLVAISFWASPLRAQEDSPETAEDPTATETDTTPPTEAQPEETFPTESAPPATAPPPATAAEPEPASEPTTGTLKVVTRPAGATVTISDSKRGEGRVIGETPMEVPLKPWTYWVTVTKERHFEHKERLTLRAGMEKSIDLDLEYNQWTALRVTSILTFWPGLLCLVGGGVSGYLGWYYGQEYRDDLDKDTKNESKRWTAFMYAGVGTGVALVTTGIICHYLNKKKLSEGSTTVGAAPTQNGGMVLLGRRF